MKHKLNNAINMKMNQMNINQTQVQPKDKRWETMNQIAMRKIVAVRQPDKRIKTNETVSL